MIEVTVENFQSVEKLSLNVEGFSAIVGRSNIGKSAIVRAIQCALTGATGTDFVRHRPECERLVRGNKKCKCQATVTLKTEKLKLIWEKGDAVNQYTVWQAGETGKGTVYSKIDRGTPDFLLPDFEPVKVGKDNDLIQVSEQFSPIFLLDQSGNTVADVLSDVAQLDQVNVAMSLVSKDRKGAMSTRSVRERDILELGETLARFDGLDQVAADAQDMEDRFQALGAAQKVAEQLDGYVDAWESLDGSVGLLEVATKPALPADSLLREALRKLSELSRFFQAVVERAPVVRRLSGIDKVELPDDTPLKEVAEKRSQLGVWLARLREFKAEIPALKKVASFDDPDPAPLRKTLARLGASQSFLDKQTRLKAVVPKLEQALSVTEPDVAPVQVAASKVMAIQSFLDKQDRLEKAVPKLERDLAKAEKAVADILDQINELGVCPTCTQDIDADHCLHLETA